MSIKQVIKDSTSNDGELIRKGHSFNVGNDSGKVIFIDVQNNNNIFYTKEEFRS